MRVNGKLEAGVLVEGAGGGRAEVQRDARRAAASFGVIGSNHTTNEENFYLQKFARQVLGTNNIDHHRTGDVVTLARRAERQDRRAGHRRRSVRAARRSWSSAPTWRWSIRCSRFQIRANLPASSGACLRGHARSRCARTSTLRPVVRVEPGGELAALESLRDKLKAEPELVILFGDAIKGDDVRKLVEFGESLGIPVKYVCLVDYSNSRGAVDMGLLPELLPATSRAAQPGMHVGEMLGARIWTCCGWSARIRSKGGARSARPASSWCRKCS